jgi:hypothetical protein
MKHELAVPTIKMKTAFCKIAALVFAAVSGVAANPAPMGMPVDVSERASGQ